MSSAKRISDSSAKPPAPNPASLDDTVALEIDQVGEAPEETSRVVKALTEKLDGATNGASATRPMAVERDKADDSEASPPANGKPSGDAGSANTDRPTVWATQPPAKPEGSGSASGGRLKPARSGRTTVPGSTPQTPSFDASGDSPKGTGFKDVGTSSAQSNGHSISARQSSNRSNGGQRVAAANPFDVNGSSANEVNLDPTNPFRPSNGQSRVVGNGSGQSATNRTGSGSENKPVRPTGPKNSASASAAAGTAGTLSAASVASGGTSTSVGGLSNGVSNTSAVTSSPGVSASAASAPSVPAPSVTPNAPTPGVGQAAAGAPRTVRLTVARVNPWSVLKLSFILSFAIGIAFFIATIVLWEVLNALGVFTSLDQTIRSVGSNDSVDIYTYFGLTQVVSLATVVAVLNIVIMTALSTVMAFLYNLASGLVGGLQVTLSDD